MVQIKLMEDDDVVKLEGDFRCCPLWKTRNNIVWKRGTCDKDVDVLFIGEAPGKEEDLQGRPFVGRAGKILDKWIIESEINKYSIINIVKCRPPNNRTPNMAEIRSCLPHLVRQIKELNPKVIVALGRISMSVLVNKTEVTANLGKIFNTRFGKVIIFPHPSYILRGANVYIPISELKNILKNIIKN